MLLRLRKAALSLCLSAGFLGIVNIETIWQEYHHASLQENYQLLKAPAHQAHKILSLPQSNPLQAELAHSLEGDELHEENPFARLSSLDPLEQIMQKGILHFHRETYRSPDYHEESGYDIVSYNIEQNDGSKSTILAYLERGVGDVRIPFVVIMLSSEKGSSYSFFRSGDLVEQSDLTAAESQALISRRLTGGIPFLSVSR